MSLLRPGLRIATRQLATAGRARALAPALAPAQARARAAAHRLALLPPARLASTASTTAPPQDTVATPAAPRAAPGSSDSTGSSGSSSSSSSSGSSSSSSSPPPQPGPYARFKALTKQYGSYAVVMYVLLSTVDFGLTFLAVHAVGADRVAEGLAPAVSVYRRARFDAAHAAALDAADARRRAEERGAKEDARRRRKERERARREGRMTDAMRDEERGEKARGGKSWYEDPALWAEAALAYGIHKTALLPIRAGLTVAWTPRVVEALRRAGWIKAAKKVTPA